MFSRSTISLLLYFIIYVLFIVLIAGIAEGQLMQMTCEDMQCDLQCVQQFKCREARCEWMVNEYGRGKLPPHVYYTVFLSLIRSTIQDELFISSVDENYERTPMSILLFNLLYTQFEVSAMRLNWITNKMRFLFTTTTLFS